MPSQLYPQLVSSLQVGLYPCTWISSTTSPAMNPENAAEKKGFFYLLKLKTIREIQGNWQGKKKRKKRKTRKTLEVGKIWGQQQLKEKGPLFFWKRGWPFKRKEERVAKRGEFRRNQEVKTSQELKRNGFSTFKRRRFSVEEGSFFRQKRKKSCVRKEEAFKLKEKARQSSSLGKKSLGREVREERCHFF